MAAVAHRRRVSLSSSLLAKFCRSRRRSAATTAGAIAFSATRAASVCRMHRWSSSTSLLGDIREQRQSSWRASKKALLRSQRLGVDAPVVKPTLPDAILRPATQHFRDNPLGVCQKVSFGAVIFRPPKAIRAQRGAKRGPQDSIQKLRTARQCRVESAPAHGLPVTRPYRENERWPSSPFGHLLQLAN
eukprot:scaffold650_cov249-Pinguiococcus_pyrenoidosus.AAC.16